MKITWKKLLTLSLAAVMALSLAACGGNDSSADDQSANQTQEEAAPPADTEENTAAPESSGDGAAAADGNVLVVYYSASGNTETAANYIAQATGGDIFEITPAEPYTSDDLNWTDENSRVSREHEDESLRDVELTTTEVENWDSYDTVFIGSPIWGASPPGRWTALWRPTTSPARRSSPSAPPPAPAWARAENCWPSWPAPATGWRDSGSAPAPARRM